jgi:hypothetical protein
VIRAGTILVAILAAAFALAAPAAAANTTPVPIGLPATPSDYAV